MRGLPECGGVNSCSEQGGGGASGSHRFETGTVDGDAEAKLLWVS